MFSTIWLPTALLMRVWHGPAVGATHDVPTHRDRLSGAVNADCAAGRLALIYAIPFTSRLKMNSPVPTRPPGSRRSIATLLRHVCGNLKLRSVTARSTLVAGAPVTLVGLYASGFGLKGNALVAVTVSMSPVR